MTSHHLKAVAKLIVAVKERNGKPINVNVVAASIESFGIRDMDVKEDYGFEDISDLARYIYKSLDFKAFANLKNNKQRVAEFENRKKLALTDYITARNTKRFVRDYTAGLIHLFPVFLQVVGIVLFGFSLWTFSKFNNLQSTAVVLGVIIGFVVTGGFVQVVGKQVSFYWYNKDFVMAKHSIINIIRNGVLTMLAVFGLIAILNIVLPLYPFSFILITFIYAFLIGFLLLVLSPLYAIKQRWVLSVSILIGSLTAFFFHFYTPLYIYIVHWVGILTSCCCSVIFLYFFLKHTLGNHKGLANAAPKLMLSVYRNFNYFFYGILLFIFVFLDRILAWSSTLNRNIPYVVYYEKNYEIGMDLAILMFFLMGGVLEYSISSYNRHMDFHQLKTKYFEYHEFNKKLMKMYVKHLRIFFFSASVIAFFLYCIITKPWGYQAGFDESLLPLSIKVCVIGGAGYLFLTLGMLNVLYAYTLGQHRKPLVAIIIALACNLVVGILLSRLISYEYSVVGMLVGSIVFAFITTLDTYRFFKNLDYYYYAAY
ncbi:hypothetical protein [Flavimarina sp. Hel_I_48]|uniref:hypothetical protein n=1 Tax=Flavimarina sp. Hel_I_48 TaxID=1392488 RepID=UPI00068E59B4|nr:hypothetical protein [Flavimarina sp. Hel_I_48]